MRFASSWDMLCHWAHVAPLGLALVGEDEWGKGCAYTWAELREEVARRASELEDGAKTCEAILVDGSAACVIEVFAAVHAGMQVALLDGSVPSERMGALLGYVDADALWGSPHTVRELEPSLGSGVDGGAGKMLFFTSGTTSRAKAVELSDASLMASAHNGSELLPLDVSDVLLCVLPLAHVFGYVCGVLWGLSCGATVALGRGPRHYLDDCAHFAPTVLVAVPTLLSFLVAHDLLNPELELVLVGAGDCDPEVLAAVARSGRQVAFGYGLTETSSGVALGTGDDPYAMTVCPDFTVSVAEDGEVCVSSGTCMMAGYYKMPADTAQVLRDGVLHTGDLGKLDADGRLHITGRKKEMLVLSNGTKVYLPEYEADLKDALGTDDLAVCAEGNRLILVMGSSDLTRPEVMARIDRVMRLLPRGSQIADVVELGRPLPRTATGKVQRWQIEEQRARLWGRPV